MAATGLNTGLTSLKGTFYFNIQFLTPFLRPQGQNMYSCNIQEMLTNVNMEEVEFASCLGQLQAKVKTP